MRPLDLEVAESAWDSLHNLTIFWEKFHSDQRIDELVDELMEAADWLRTHPGAGAAEVHMRKTRYTYRRWVVGHVKIVYRVTRTAIRVSDIFDSRQDPRKMKG